MTSHNNDGNTQLKENLVGTGRMFCENYREHINKDLIVKRIQPAKNNLWYNDYCMFITEIKDNCVYGDIYLNGVLTSRGFYPDSDSFMVYKSPNEEKILRDRDDELPF
jgi:hypothetical protein